MRRYSDDDWGKMRPIFLLCNCVFDAIHASINNYIEILVRQNHSYMINTIRSSEELTERYAHSVLPARRNCEVA